MRILNVNWNETQRKTRDCVRTAPIDVVDPAGDVELSQGLSHFLFLVAQAERDDWNNWNFGTFGTDVSLKRFERSAAIERLEQLSFCEGDLFTPKKRSSL